MEEQKTIAGRKVIKSESYELNDYDKHILSNLGQQIGLAQDTLELARFNVNAYLGSLAVQRWEWPEGRDISFSDVSVEDGKVTVNELEPTNDPKNADAQPATGEDVAIAEPANGEAASEPEAGQASEERPSEA